MGERGKKIGKPIVFSSHGDSFIYRALEKYTAVRTRTVTTKLSGTERSTARLLDESVLAGRLFFQEHSYSHLLLSLVFNFFFCAPYSNELLHDELALKYVVCTLQLSDGCGEIETSRILGNNDSRGAALKAHIKMKIPSR